MAPRGAQIELLKKDICLGGIFWLREDAKIRDEEAFGRSGLEEEALGHPAVVIDTLPWRCGYVWICVIRGTYRRWRGDIPISESEYRWPQGEVCRQCNTDHQYNPKSTHQMNALTLETIHMPGKPRHVGSRDVYEVSIAMLRLGVGVATTQVYRLDGRSLEVLRKRAGRSLRLLRRNSFALAQLAGESMEAREETPVLTPAVSNTTDSEAYEPKEETEATVGAIQALTLAQTVDGVKGDKIDGDGGEDGDGDGGEERDGKALEEVGVEDARECEDDWTTVMNKKKEKKRQRRKGERQH